MSEKYTLDDLLDAYIRSIRPRYGVEKFRVFDEHRATCMARCFGVSFDDEVRHVLAREAGIPHPFDSVLEATMLVQRFRERLHILDEARTALIGFYRERARQIAQGRWGNLKTRTHAQLLKAGFDPSSEPVLDDWDF